MPARTYSSARERILDAAERLIVSRGVNQLTVEAVITEAGISKGGFFHHFATKDALLMAIVDRLTARVNDDATRRAAQDPEPRGARLRAQIALTFDEDKRETAAPRALLLAIIEAASAQPALARHGSKLTAEAVARDAAEDIPEGRAIAIQFALDGFWLSQALGAMALSEGQLRALRDALLALAQPEAGAGRRPRRPRASKKGGPA
ncbi:TetR/AcrR family transcriptional regulator [Sorangium sp. So ce296]|uniref:TetR family transcriptional regulator n=1 Tax=Sorangium cellulosum TaxID=56 RepID=A0A150SVC7_SORCE|nr:TetR family transcriptional regulator [Sorangium cellulosum]KYF96416.1 TetR family transcriptional regulator [Sorangium cellulosum]